MSRLKTTSALLVPFLYRASALQYQLVQEYNASNFFEEFNFFSGPDPTGGFVQYVSEEVAASTPLIGNSSDLIYIGVDNSNVYTPGGVGRPSVRLESKLTFTEGLFVIDLTHIPVGCGAWPALWTTGLNDWPSDGEIDIIENVNDARANNAAIHATGDCFVDAATSQTGTWKSTDCSIGHDDNQGCGTVFTEPFNYGSEFNANGGGVYAMEWTSNAIKIWFFSPTNVPLNLLNGGVPDSATFGTPSSVFNGSCSDSFSEKFFNHSIIIDTTFCGGWAGGTFGTGSSSCPIKEGLSPQDSCIDFVANNPEAFKDAYWGIRSVKVWEKVPGFTVQDLSTPGIALPWPVATIEPVDVLIKGPVSWNVSKPTATIEPLVSLLTGGVLNAGDDSEDIFEDDDTTEDDLDDILDIANDFFDLDSLSDLFDTEEPSGIIIDIDIGPASSAAAALLNQAATTLYGGGILDTPSASSVAASIIVPFGVGNTEGHKDLFPPELSLPVPTKSPRIPAPNGNTGIVPPHLQQLPPVRQQNPVPSGAVGVQIPNTLPLLLPQPVDNAAQPGLDPLQIDTPAVTASEVAAPEPPALLAIPQLNDSAPNDLTVGPEPASGDNTLLTAPELSNPLIPTGIGNTGVVPPSISESPIVSLWSSFSPELKNKLIAAAKNLPLPSPGSSPLTDLWASLSLELKNEVLNAANNLPASTLENSVPTISDLINAASTGKVTSIPSIPGLPALDVLTAFKPAGGLLGFLDAKTKNKLKALFGKTSAPPTGGDDRKRQVPALGSVAGGASATDLQPLPDLVDSTVSNALSQPAASNPQPLPDLLQSTAPDTITQLVVNNLPPIPDFLQDTVPNALPQPAASNTQPLPDLLQSTAPDTITQPVVNNLPPIPDFLQDTVPNALHQPVAPVLNLTPNVPVTALTSTDTIKAMAGLLSFLDDSTKDQIVDLLLSDTSAEDVSQSPIDNVDGVVRRSDAPWLILQTWNEAKQGLLDDTNSKEITELTRRETTSVWSPQDKLALAQNVYALCPVPALIGIPFPSPKDLAAGLLDPSKTLEDVLAAFQRKLQAYFDVTVQGCWTKINQWLAWRQLLSKPGTSHILPYPYPPLPKRAMRIQVRQKDDVAVEDSDPQSLLEQQIYTICPKPDTFSTDQLIADLEDKNTSIEIAIGRFQNKLWAYMAKLQECSDKIRQYGPKLKALSGTPPNEPVFHTTEHEGVNRHHARQVPSSVVSTTDLLDYLTKQKHNGKSYEGLPFDDKKSIHEALLAGTSAGWPGNPRAKEELQHLVFQLTQAPAPQPWGGAFHGSQDVANTGSTGPGPIDSPTGNAAQPGDNGGASAPGVDGDDFTTPGPDSEGSPPLDDNDSPSTVNDGGALLLATNGGDDLPPPPKDDSGNGGLDISLPFVEGGPDGGFDDGIDTPPGSGDNSAGDVSTADDGTNRFAPGEPNPSSPNEFAPNEGAGAGSDGSNGVELADDTNAAPAEGDTNSGPSVPGSDPFTSSLADDGSSGALVGGGSADAPIEDGSQDTASVEAGAIAPSNINTPSEAPPVEPIPADDTAFAPETSAEGDGTQDTAPLVEDSIFLPTDSIGDANPPFPIEPQGFRFRSRILRSLPHRRRQEDADGVIPDAFAPAGLDAILGPHGTLDPYGFLGPQIASSNTPTTASDPHDSPTAADNTLFDLPDTAVDEASPAVDQALRAGEQDPFGQLTYSKDASEEDAEDGWESKEFWGKLRDHEESEKSGKYLGDPKDVSDFVSEFYNGDKAVSK